MYTEPQQNMFNFTGGDYVLNLAEKNGMRVRCHNLVWSSQISDWVTSGTWTAATLTAVMKNHIYNLVTHWGNRCYSWDVVNEAVDDQIVGLGEVAPGPIRRARQDERRQKPSERKRQMY